MSPSDFNLELSATINMPTPLGNHRSYILTIPHTGQIPHTSRPQQKAQSLQDPETAQAHHLADKQKEAGEEISVPGTVPTRLDRGESYSISIYGAMEPLFPSQHVSERLPQDVHVEQ